ncbi:MAG TPA: PrsW family intramembrane metalloprotease [Planctomycetes bacterium]|nr:PrsW family intramembrane metalloprotease [Planctomycetaceae bacterium]HIN94024.1 PrsW family intramembrane metalloprotease [Planctomycetota bacterium]
MILVIFLVAVFGSVIPAAIYVSILWWLDRYEKEPWWLMALTFFWGAVPAIILAIITQLIITVPMVLIGLGEVDSIAEMKPGDPVPAFLIGLYAVVAPLTEETLKAFPLLFIFFVFRREFDGLMDGLLYGALVGFGFAMTENFFYIFGTGASAGLQAEIGVFLLRTIAFGMMHALWSSMFGVGLGIARYARSKSLAFIAPCAGLALAMLMHGTHNLSAVMASTGGTAAVVWLSIMFTSYGVGCLVWIVLVVVAGRHESKMIREELQEEVETGLITGEHAIACSRYRSRVAIRWHAFREHGVGQWHKLGRLYCLAADLAFKKRQLQLQPSETRNIEEINRLRNELQELRTTLEV